MKGNFSDIFLRGIGSLWAALVLVFMSINVHGQSAKRSEAYQALDNGDIEKAQEIYRELIETEGDNPLICFEAGIAFFKGNSDDQALAKEYFEMAHRRSEKNDTIRELYYYLGRVQQSEHFCQEALDSYEKFKPKIRNNQHGEELRVEVEDYIKMCQHCIYHQQLNEVDPMTRYERRKDQHKYFINEDEYYLLENLGDGINTSHSDYASIFFENETNMLFTSRRHESDADTKDDDGKFYEDIYITFLQNARWAKPTEIDHSNLFASDFISHHLHDATVSMGPKEDHMYLYQDHQIWVSDRRDGIWEAPVLLGPTINEPSARVSSAFLNETEDMLIVASDREGGYGEHDLYIARKQGDGSWGELENMGAVLNTEKDEESPWLRPDGKRIYFSSRGHSSIGGYDVFYSDMKDDGSWSTPVNLGIPINTANDELHFLISKVDTQFAYYSSNRAGGYGEFDIYKISKNLVSKEKDLEMEQIIYEDSIFAEVEMRRGKVYTDRIEQLYEEGKITLEEIIAENLTGAYPILDNEQLDALDSTVLARKGMTMDEYLTSLTVEDDKSGGADGTSPTLDTTGTSGGQIAGVDGADGADGTSAGGTGGGAAVSGEDDLFANIEFAFNQTSIPAAHRKQLDGLVAFMKENPNYIMDLSGHTDDVGTEEINVEFSKRRALVIYNYLIDQGVDPKRIKYHFYGETKPLVPNTTDENRARNRRVELELQKTLFYRHVNFGIASHYITDEGMKTLDAAIQFLQNNPGRKIQLNGYTDITGAVAYNRALSRRRAEGAMKYLIGRGIAESDIEYNYYGIESPVSPNTTEATRQFNRRVEIVIEDPSARISRSQAK